MTLPAFVLSFDFEIGWGDVTNGRWIARERRGTYVRLRKVLPRLLAAMDELELPATWATVGAMIAPPDTRDYSHLPADAARIVAESIARGEKASFDGIDLFEAVLAHERTGHRIACHSYSHVPFGFAGVDSETVRADLLRAADTFAAHGIRTDRFVFPENDEACHEVLRSVGMLKARTPAVRTASSRLRYLISTVVDAPPEAIIRAHPSGLELESGSMLFNMGVGKAYRMPFVSRRARAGLRALSARRSSRMHVWAHPFNFAESDLLLDSFVRFLKQVAAERDAGRLTVELM